MSRASVVDSPVLDGTADEAVALDSGRETLVRMEGVDAVANNAVEGVRDDVGGRTGVMSRRAFSRGALVAAAGFLAGMGGVSGVGEARAQDDDSAVDGVVDDTAVEMSNSREAKYAKVRAEGLRRIAKKQDYTLKFQMTGRYDIIAIRFEENKEGIIVLTFTNKDEKLGEEITFIRGFETLLDSYENSRHKFPVEELD